MITITKLFKWLCAILTGYLLYIEMATYLLTPTHTTYYTKQLEPSDFPDITICPYPAYNITNLKKHGYKTAYEYTSGMIADNREKVSWGGIHNETTEKILEDVSIFKESEDCPYTSALGQEVNLTLNKATHPIGRCCSALAPVIEDKQALQYFIVAPKDHLKHVEYRVFLKDKSSAFYALTGRANMIGDNIVASQSISGTSVFDVKVSNHLLLENDPKVNCVNYKETSGYSNCLGKV